MSDDFVWSTSGLSNFMNLLRLKIEMETFDPIFIAKMGGPLASGMCVPIKPGFGVW